jgi:hypothetical protein
LIHSFTTTTTTTTTTRAKNHPNLHQSKKTKMATTFKQVDLFGGAITADFPAAFGDVR